MTLFATESTHSKFIKKIQKFLQRIYLFSSAFIFFVFNQEKNFTNFHRSINHSSDPTNLNGTCFDNIDFYRFCFHIANKIEGKTTSIIIKKLYRVHYGVRHLVLTKYLRNNFLHLSLVQF